MKKVSMVKVAMFRVVDQYTREDKCVVISKCPVSKPLREAKAFVNECLAKHFACVAECEEKGPMPTAIHYFFVLPLCNLSFFFYKVVKSVSF